MRGRDDACLKDASQKPDAYFVLRGDETSKPVEDGAVMLPLGAVAALYCTLR